MSTRKKVGLLVAVAAAITLVAGLGAYQLIWKEQLRPATTDEVSAHLQGVWVGTSVNNVQEIREGTITIRLLGGNRFDGEEDWRGQSRCPDKVFSGTFADDKVSWAFTYVNVSPGSPSYCSAKGHADLEMKIGEDGTPHLIGTWEVEGWTGSLELTESP